MRSPTTPSPTASFRGAEPEADAAARAEAAAINEAIELGKRYSTEKSGAFINGILDKIKNRGAGSDDPGEPPPVTPSAQEHVSSPEAGAEQGAEG